MTPSKCSICGGELTNDYINGLCICGHCGNKWQLKDLDVDYKRYEHIAARISKADSVIADCHDLKQVEEALLLYRSTAAECGSPNPAETAFKQHCRDAIKTAGELKTYFTAKEHFNNKAYSKAMKEFAEVAHLRDSQAMIQNCRTEIEKERVKRIPYSIIVGLILPLILFFFLKEHTNTGAAAIISAAAAALDIFVIYRGGGLSTAVEIVSFVLSVPLVLFLILVYVFRFSAAFALAVTAGVCIGIPLLLLIAAFIKDGIG